ncbi:MAG: SGNH/GDSL hydrolase family protein [Deltaproteobacteria bacterium]|nr:SGNH/GDSL hydrolase family protein [Deltaproteobacteria bacterium]
MFETKISSECVTAINNHRILFAHMSVGNDILSGLSAANRVLEKQVILKKIETKSSSDITGGGIYGIEIGANTQPLQKLFNLRQFLLSNNNGRSFDLVGIKFCYVDITQKTDIHALLKEYAAVLKDIKERYPHITFVHFTVPLTTHYSGLKNRVKYFILGDQNNIKRNTYNELLCDAYKNEVIIDIARIESSYPDGSRLKHAYFQSSHYSLLPEYTTDGGHLNELGKKIMVAPFAEGLCRALSD